MKKRVYICILAAILAASIVAPPASAAEIGVIGVLDYTVSATRINMEPSGAGAFTITVPKPTGEYTAYAGVSYALQLPAGAEITGIEYNLPIGDVLFPPERDSGGTYWFSNSSSENAFTDDMVCTVRIAYYRTNEASITVYQVRQMYNSGQKSYTEEKVSDKANQKLVTLVPNPAAALLDASLSSLEVSAGELKPAFAPGTIYYTVDVPNSTSSITITAVASAASAGATVTGDGAKTLNVGANLFDVTVTSPDGSMQRTYSITVTRSSTSTPNNPPGPGNPSGPSGPVTSNPSQGSTPSTGATPNEGEPSDITDLMQGPTGPTDIENNGTDASGIRYLDVADPSEWYYEAVYYVTGKGLMIGTGDNLFSPEDPVTRAMFVTILGRMAENMGEATTGFSNPFEDVPADEWYTQYVAWGADKDIVLGYSETEFGPDDPVTREQMAALIIRFCEYLKIDLDDSRSISFSDADSISDWAQDPVRKAAAAGLMQGSEGMFFPESAATRAEIAQLFMNLYEAYLV